MEHIGLRIKQLRKKKDLTQEKLAEYLGVSFQAVSKWETGVASPDLSMVVPLARLLEVSTDELLGLIDTVEDPRERELRTAYNETWKTGDIEKRYDVSKLAVKEYPGNFEYLYWLADSETYYAIHCYARGSDDQIRHLENSVRHFEMVIEDSPDADIRDLALSGIVWALSDLSRREEALKYAKQHPNCDELLRCCLQGDAWEEHHQKMIMKKLVDLVMELEYGRRSLKAVQAAEQIIKVVIDDENYLGFYDALMHNYIWQAECYTRERRYEEAIESLRKSYGYAVLHEEVFDRAKTAPIPYTSSILNRISYDASTIFKSGTTTLVEDFKEYLSWKQFDALRDRPDFAELLSL